MTTVNQTNNPEMDWGEAPDISEIFQTDFNGESCITAEGLDWVWPTDDRPPLDIGGKGFNIPPTCEEQIPCHEKYGDQVCLEFFFNGSKPIDAAVPLSGTLIFSLICVAAFLFLKKLFETRKLMNTVVYSTPILIALIWVITL